MAHETGYLHDDFSSDPMLTFVSTNRGVYNAVCELLEAAADPTDLFNATLPSRHALLHGGEPQLAILREFAEENGLQAIPQSGWGREASLLLKVPGKPLTLTVDFR